VFAYIRQKFPEISKAKKKEGVFVFPQITQLFQDQYFGTMLNSTERSAWKAFEKSAETF